MSERTYNGFVSRVDDDGYSQGTDVVKFTLREVCGLSIMDGAGMAAPAYFACLSNFTQVQIHKNVFDRLTTAGKEVASLA